MNRRAVPSQPPVPEPFMTTAEVRRWLHVSENQVYRLADRGEFPCYRVGRERRYLLSEIRAYVLRARGDQ